ncbi:MAG: NAD(P)-dependent oxidoreductase [Candidatus Korobacteraceae bacterium]
MTDGLRSALVTGSTGFLGSVLVGRLLAQNVEVTCLVRSRSLAKAAWLVGDTRVRIVEFEGDDLEAKLADVSAEAVFNLASYGVREGDCDVDEMIHGNITILLRLLRATAGWPLRRFVHAGSCSEYGYPEQEGIPLAESHRLQPKTLYGAAKAASVLCGSALAYSLGVPFVTLRLFGVYGSGEGPQRLIPYIIYKLASDLAVDLTGGEQVRDLLFEDDAISAFLAAITSEGIESGQVYNICSSRPVRIRDMGEMVADAMNKPRDLLHWGARPYRTGEPMWLVGDNSRFRGVASRWFPTIDLQEGVRLLVEHTGRVITRRD